MSLGKKIIKFIQTPLSKSEFQTILNINIFLRVNIFLFANAFSLYLIHVLGFGLIYVYVPSQLFRIFNKSRNLTRGQVVYVSDRFTSVASSFIICKQKQLNQLLWKIRLIYTRQVILISAVRQRKLQLPPKQSATNGKIVSTLVLTGNSSVRFATRRFRFQMFVIMYGQVVILK